MIFEIENYTRNYCISKKTGKNARFTAFDVSSSRISKNYTTASGETIIYGVRKDIKSINFVIECDREEFTLIGDILNSSFTFIIRYNQHNDELYMKNENGQIITDFNDNPIFADYTEQKTVYISGDITEKCICNSSGGIYTISGKFMEV